jgi:hypothetical protein
MITVSPLVLDRHARRVARRRTSEVQANEPLIELAQTLRPRGVARPLDPGDRDLLRRADLLPPADRLMVELVYVRALPVRQVGRLTGHSPGTVTRRARRLRGRLLHPVVTALLEPWSAAMLSTAQRALAVAHFARGVSAWAWAGRGTDPSTPDTPARRGITRAVLRELDYLRGWARAAAARRVT